MSPDPITLEIFKHLFASVAEEMGVTLRRTAYSPNIKERLDFSCALFDGEGRLLAQAAHIPVHLGAMPASVRSAIEQCSPFAPGDVVILNDPYLGGTHLPDITLVSPVFIDAGAGLAPAHSGDRKGTPLLYVASRAHHADVGGMSPGSMPLSSEIYQEGLIIPPVKIVDAGKANQAVLDLILRNVRTPDERRGDLDAQMAAHEVGARRAREIVARYGLQTTLAYAAALIEYAERLTRHAIASMPDGAYTFEDYLDDEELSNFKHQISNSQLPITNYQSPVTIKVILTIEGNSLSVDFTGSSPAVRGNLNAVRAIVESAVYYCVRCVVGAMGHDDAPTNAGAFAPIRVIVPEGSVLDAKPPHAVAGGNVETSQRIVDAVFGALARALPDLIPAASQGTMNNLTFGGVRADGAPFAYYETMGGGAGAGPLRDGASGIHVHMSNTLNTPIEALELAFPLRVRQYAIRCGSGGAGRRRGGDGLIREIEFLAPVTATLLGERRAARPYGLSGGEPGAPGENALIREGVTSRLPGKVQLQLDTGDVLSIRTPGGGGWGENE
ncbi:MAG TPA: hydantoinase B/oxoprolinase family protein [Anaerolineae bacterium]|nr:hydantoinase B/oxoprolinase family protein [Anaerolineae bacterium]